MVMKGMEVKKGRREAVEEILGVTGVKVNVQEVRRSGGNAEKGREMVLVTLRDEE